MKDRFLNSTDPVKLFGRILLLLFSTGLIFLIGYYRGIDPAPYSYIRSVTYFTVIYLLSYPIQVGFEYAKYKHIPSSGSYMYNWNVELVIFILYILLMPFTSDLGS